MPLCRLGALPPAVPYLAGTVGVALLVILAALRRPDEGEQAGYGLRDGPQRRRRLMGWEGGYFLRSEIKKEGRELLD